jgi:hypothetical protein
MVISQNSHQHNTQFSFTKKMAESYLCGILYHKKTMKLFKKYQILTAKARFTVHSHLNSDLSRLI